MKLQSPTLILVFVAIALGSFVAVTELRPTPSGYDNESQTLFDFEEEEVRSLVIETTSRTLKFEKEDGVLTDHAESGNGSDSSASNGDAEIDSESEETAEGTTKEIAEETTGETDNSEDNPPESDSKELDESSSESENSINTASNADVPKEEGARDSEDDEDEDENDSDDETEEPIDTGTEWQMRSPDEAPADDSAVVFLVNLMASGVSDRVFEVEPENLDSFGFDSPLAEVEVTLENDESHRLILGNYDFNGANIYAQATSSEGDAANTGKEAESSESQTATDDATVQVFIVSTSFDAAVNRPLEEWKQTDENQAEEQPDTSEDGEKTPDESE